MAHSRLHQSHSDKGASDPWYRFPHNVPHRIPTVSFIYYNADNPDGSVRHVNHPPPLSLRGTLRTRSSSPTERSKRKLPWTSIWTRIPLGGRQELPARSTVWDRDKLNCGGKPIGRGSRSRAWVRMIRVESRRMVRSAGEGVQEVTVIVVCESVQ